MVEEIKEDMKDVIIVGSSPPSVYCWKIIEWGQDHDWFKIRAPISHRDKLELIIAMFRYFGLKEKKDLRKEGIFDDMKRGKKVRWIEVYLEKVGAIKGPLW